MKRFFLLFIVMIMILGLVYSAGERIVMTLAGESKHIPISRVELQDKILSLTFNVNKVEDNLYLILNQLEKNHVTATFYIPRTIIENNIELIERIHNGGSEIGLLAFGEGNLKNLTRNDIHDELLSVSNFLEENIGKQLKTIRPADKYNQEIIYGASQLNVLTVLWNLDSYDHKEMGIMDIVERLRSTASKGAIVFLNSDAKYTAQAMDLVVENLLTEGYTICSVEEMINHKEEWK